MPFDRDAAKAAGYSDEEIDYYLSSKRAAAPAARGSSTPRRTGFAESALATLTPIGATLGAVLGGTGGAAAGGIGAVPGVLVGTSAGAASGRILEQAVRRLLGAPPAQAEVFGVPLPQAFDLPETALGYASGQAAGGVVAAAPGAAFRALRAAPAGVRKAALRFLFGQIPGVRTAQDLAELATTFRRVPPAEVAATRPPARRPALPRNRGPQSREQTLYKPAAAAAPKPPGSLSELATVLERSLELERQMTAAGFTSAQKAMVRAELAGPVAPGALGNVMRRPPSTYGPQVGQ